MSKAAAAAAASSIVPPEGEKLLRFGALLRSAWRARESGVLWNEHEIVPEAETPFERVLEADYWANIAGKLKQGDTLVVMPEDGGWRAELVVWNVGHNWAQVAPLYKMERPDFGASPGAAEDEFEIGYAGPIKKHRVIRKKDRAELKAGFESPGAARRWLDDHRKALRS